MRVVIMNNEKRLIHKRAYNIGLPLVLVDM